MIASLKTQTGPASINIGVPNAIPTFHSRVSDRCVARGSDAGRWASARSARAHADRTNTSQARNDDTMVSWPEKPSVTDVIGRRSTAGNKPKYICSRPSTMNASKPIEFAGKCQVAPEQCLGLEVEEVGVGAIVELRSAEAIGEPGGDGQVHHGARCEQHAVVAGGHGVAAAARRSHHGVSSDSVSNDMPPKSPAGSHEVPGSAASYSGSMSKWP